ncbi:MAG: ferrous iron transport protein B [Planctomycetota bacterium]
MSEEKKKITVGLAGNPNSGKTSIFNNITGARQHVGNYPGVTVEKREGEFTYKNYAITFVDLPGTYSLSPYSIEEIAARDFIIRERPDVIVNVVDASNLERNLYLTAQLIDLHAHMVVALNMVDVAQKRNIHINQKKLSKLLGAPVVPTIGRAKEGMDELLEEIVRVAEDPEALTRHIHIDYGQEVEDEIEKVKQIINNDEKLSNSPYYPRWLSARAIENDSDVRKHIKREADDADKIFDVCSKSRSHLESIFAESIDGIIADRIYSFLHGLCLSVVDSTREIRITRSDKIDKILTNKAMGFPIFFFLMWLMFQGTFTLAEAPMGWLEAIMEGLKGIVENNMSESMFKSLLLGGVIDGVGGVVIFLPNILILFFFLALLDDTGYMARAAFLMDRIMHNLGLHGKSFISMLIGFGCNVPGIMATRTLESRQDRLITILVNPLMSCSARYPVYALFCAAFFTRNQGLIILSVYVLGMVLAIAAGKLFRKTLFKGEDSPFVLELPPYRIPTFNSVMIHMWDRGKIFLQKAGGIILIGTILVWFINEFPKDENLKFSRDYPAAVTTTTEYRDNQLTELKTAFEEAKIAAESKYAEEVKDDKVKQFVGFEKSSQFLELEKHYKEESESIKDKYGKEIANLQNQFSAEKVSQKYSGRIGKVIEPLIKPLGFDWRLGISLIPGFTAKEIVVSSLGVIFGAGEGTDDEESQQAGSLRQKLRNAYTPLIAYCFMVFTLIYTPCMATVAVIKRETGSWGWAFFSIAYSLVLAWGVTFVFFNVGKLLGFG